MLSSPGKGLSVAIGTRSYVVKHLVYEVWKNDEVDTWSAICLQCPSIRVDKADTKNVALRALDEAIMRKLNGFIGEMETVK